MLSLVESVLNQSSEHRAELTILRCYTRISRPKKAVTTHMKKYEACTRPDRVTDRIADRKNQIIHKIISQKIRVKKPKIR